MCAVEQLKRLWHVDCVSCARVRERKPRTSPWAVQLSPIVVSFGLLADVVVDFMAAVEARRSDLKLTF